MIFTNLWRFQITKSYLVSDKYRSEVALKIDTVKGRETPGTLPPWLHPLEELQFGDGAPIYLQSIGQSWRVSRLLADLFTDLTKRTNF